MYKARRWPNCLDVFAELTSYSIQAIFVFDILSLIKVVQVTKLYDQVNY